MNHLSAPSVHTKPSSSSFRIYLRPFIWAIFQNNNTDNTIGKYLNLEGASIYINPEGLDHLRNTVENGKFDDQTISIEHLDSDSYKIGYFVQELDGGYSTIYDTINSLEDITDIQLTSIVQLWSIWLSTHTTLHFREKLNLACGNKKVQSLLPKSATKVADTLR